MPDSNPSASAAAGPQSPNMQQLAALLGSLMPLLQRFQSQVLEEPARVGPGHVVVPNPALDHQAAVNLVGDFIAVSLRTLSSYLEANAERYAGLDGCVPIVTLAAHRFAAHDYAHAFDLIWQAYRVIATIRAADPAIPPLQAGGQAPSDQTSSLH
jgi:hypothetical protein